MGMTLSPHRVSVDAKGISINPRHRLLRAWHWLSHELGRRKPRLPVVKLFLSSRARRLKLHLVIQYMILHDDKTKTSLRLTVHEESPLARLYAGAQMHSICCINFASCVASNRAMIWSRRDANLYDCSCQNH